MNINIKTSLLKYRFLFYVLLLLPIVIFRDFTPANELKYLSIAEEALADGHWFAFYNHGEAYADKPPLFMWLIMLSRWLTGGHYMWVLGLFSVLSAMGVLAIMDKWLKREGVRFNPVVPDLMLLTTGQFLILAVTVRMDMLMTFFITLSLYTFYKMYKREMEEDGVYKDRMYKSFMQFPQKSVEKERYLLPVYLFLAVFSKGPMGILIPLISIIAFLLIKKQIRHFGRYLGWRQWAIMIGLFAVWFGLVYLEGGREYLDNLLFKQTIGRGVDSYHHKEPFWYYLPRLLWMFAPWILLYLVVLWTGIRKKQINGDMEQFFLTISGVSLLILSLISSKIDIYLLPIYPFVVYLSFLLLTRNADNKVVKAVICLVATLFVLALPVVIIFGNKLLGKFFPDLTLLSIGFVFLAGGGVVALFKLRKKQPLQAVGTASLSILALLFIGSFAVPQMNKHIGFGEMAKTARQSAEQENVRQYYYYKFYTGANMDVYLNRPVDGLHTIEALDSLTQSPHKSILFVRRSEIRREEALQKWLSDKKSQWTNGRYSWYLLGGNAAQTTFP